MKTEFVITCMLSRKLENYAYIKNIQSTFRHLFEHHNQLPNVGEVISAEGYINDFGLDENHKTISGDFPGKVFKLIEKMYVSEYDIISSEYQRKINLFLTFEEL